MDFGDDLNLEHKATLDYLKDDLNDILIAAQRSHDTDQIVHEIWSRRWEH